MSILSVELGELPGAEPWRGEVLRRAAAFQVALQSCDEDGAIAMAEALAGLGEGSTPAGDDYLVGVLHALTFATHHTACIALVSHHFSGRLRGRGLS